MPEKSRTAAPPLPSLAGWLLFLSMLLLYACSYFQRTAIPGQIFDRLQLEGLSALQISHVAASFIYMYSPMQLAVGILIDRYGGVWAVRFGGVLFCLGGLLFPLQHTLTGMCLARMLTGLGAGSFYLALVRESNRIFGRERYAVVMGTVYLIGYGGGLFGTLPFEWLAGIFRWRCVLLVVGSIAVIAYLLFQGGAHWAAKPLPRQKLPVWPTLKRAASNRFVWAAIFCSSVNFGSYYTLQTLIGRKLLEDLPGMSAKGAAGVIFSLTLVCMAVLFFSSLISQLLGNRRRVLLRFAVLLNLATTLLFTAVIWRNGPWWLYVAGFIGYAVASGFANIFQISAQEQNSPDVMTQTSGLLNMINYLTVVLFSLGVGWMLERFRPASGAAAGAIHYPAEAYLLLFCILTLLSLAGVWIGFRIPETNGKFAHSPNT